MMRRSELEMFLGKMVCVDTAFHKGEPLCGELHKSGEKLFRDNPNLYLKDNYYFVTRPGTNECISYLFRSSHVRSVKKVHNARSFWWLYEEDDTNA